MVKLTRGDDMTTYNLIMVIDHNHSKILMCKRMTPPYEGLYNLVGGKVDQGETFLESAYRELKEETGILKSQITLSPLMDFAWHPFEMEMKVFVGQLEKEVELVEEIHPLVWVDMSENFFDASLYAGEGNIGHMVEVYKQSIEKGKKNEHI